MTVTLKVNCPISVGELIDKITILEIKEKKITDKAKLFNIHRELKQLSAQSGNLPQTDALVTLIRRLKTINLHLWEIEDKIRLHEADKDFGPSFVQLARAVYKTNDQRFELKSEINKLTGSELVEEKSYTDYGKS